MEEKFNENMRELGDKFRKSPIRRRIANNIWDVIIGAYFLFHPFKIPMCFKKEFREFMFDYRKRIGMLEGAIFDNGLYVPNEQGNSLEYLASVGGRWSGYDHTRRDKLKLKDLQNRETNGRLMAFPLKEILDKPNQDYTSIGLIDPLDITVTLEWVCPTAEELLNWGFVERVTYTHAFSKLGIYDRYETNLFSLGIADKLIYQVTPKGNGVIYLERDSGEKEPEKSPFSVKVPSWA